MLYDATVKNHNLEDYVATKWSVTLKWDEAGFQPKLYIGAP